MAGYLGSKPVVLTTTAADVNGNADISGDLTVDTNTLYVDSTNNNVGIGVVPTQKLQVDGDIRIGDTAVGSGDNEQYNITTGGQLLIKANDGASDISFTALTLASGSSGGAAASSSVITFELNDAEAMRLDASGNLLVGKTASATGTVGAELRANGKVVGTIDGGNHTLNRLTSDGDILRFQKDSTTVGSIGANSGGPYLVRSGLSGIAIAGGGQLIATDSSGAGSDNTRDLGAITIRWDDVYATNGTIQTSDANEKQQIASLTDAEITAAKAISTLFKTFKWNDSVAEKGDAARIHTGVIAQEVEQALTDAGLNAGDYAFFISTTWWETQTEVPAVEADEENGVEAQEAYTRTDTYDTLEEAPEGATERNRKGIRYPELLSFIGAATEQRLASIEARLTALETV